MNFSEALESMKAGAKVYRDNWNANGIVVFLYYPQSEDLVNPFLVVDTQSSGSKTKTRVPWLPSQTDILAEDWNIKE